MQFEDNVVLNKLARKVN